MAILESLANKFLGSPDMKALINFATNKYPLMSNAGRSLLIKSCSKSKLELRCVDTTLDLCPNGHTAYGLATILMVLLPGIIFAFSVFFKHRAFVLLDLDILHGQGWNLGLKILLLPFYAAAMTFLFMCVMTYT